MIINFLLKKYSQNETALKLQPASLLYQRRKVALEIEVPKGYRGCLYIESLATKKYKYQQEVLFKRGFRYIIKDIKKENGRYYMKAEAIL